MTWTSINLGEIAVQRGGSVDPKKFPTETFELYSIPAFDKGTPETVLGTEIGSTKKQVQTNDVMVSRIVPHIRRAWVVGPDNGNRQIASGEWIISRSSEHNRAGVGSHCHPLRRGCSRSTRCRQRRPWSF
jgi:type I restriction enzyme S subunit